MVTFKHACSDSILRNSSKIFKPVLNLLYTVMNIDDVKLKRSKLHLLSQLSHD